MPQVNPDILRWARETAGLSLDEAVRKLVITEARDTAAVDRLKALESGEQAPSRAMLSKMARQYHRPLLTFYLSRPPGRGNWGRDFRAPVADRSARDDALLNALVRNVQARQGLLRSAMLDEDDDLAPLAFIGSATIDTPVEQLVADIRDTLKLPLSDYRAARNPDLAFRLLRSHAEQAGIFVLLLGNLGSYHTDLDVQVFRGFALADEFTPFIVVNPRDSAGARSFTLLHELVHLWLGEPGISGGDPMDPVEVFCNRVASAFLLPDEELDALRGPNSDDIHAWAATITEFALPRNVSTSMVAYRLHRRTAIGQDTWLGLQNLFRNCWLESRERQRQKLAATDGGPPYGVLVKHNVGPGLVDLTFRLEAAGSLTATKAGKVLGVNPRSARAVLATG